MSKQNHQQNQVARWTGWLLLVLAVGSLMLGGCNALFGKYENPLDPDSDAYTGGNGGGTSDKTWTIVGGGTVSSGTASLINLSVTSGVPYVAFDDGGKTRVLQYIPDSATWSDLSGTALPITAVSALSLAVPSSGSLYLAYVESGAAVCKVSGGDGYWFLAGTTGDFTNMTAGPSGFALAGNIGKPYAAFAYNNYGYVSWFSGAAWTGPYSFSASLDMPTAAATRSTLTFKPPTAGWHPVLVHAVHSVSDACAKRAMAAGAKSTDTVEDSLVGWVEAR